MVKVELKEIWKKFGQEPVLQGINLTVGGNDFVTILGESGSGKTTLIKIVAGLTRQDRGHIYFDGKLVDDVSPGSRKTGYVPQSLVLFPHMNVFDNVGFGLVAKKEPREIIQKKVTAMLKRVGLEDMAKKYPHQISGGQMQRVALARSLVTEPEILLLDEPLSSLDSFLRQRLGFLVREMQQEACIPAIMVTHSWEEASLMSDRIIIIGQGHVIQEGPPDLLAKQPANEKVVKLTGISNVIIHNGEIPANTEHGTRSRKIAILDPSNCRLLSIKSKERETSSYGKSDEWLYFPARIASITRDLSGMNDYQAVVYLEILDHYLTIKINRDNLDNGELKNQSKVVIAVKKNAFKQVSG